MDEPAPSWSRSPAESPAGERAGASAGAVRLRQARARFGCSRTELLALGVLGLAALAALGLLAVSTATNPVALGRLLAPDPAAGSLPIGPLEIASDQPPLVVHIAGRVAAPGVHHLPAGARVGDALAAAGGALPDAALDAVNLARPLADGEQLVVPAVGDPGATPPPARTGPGGGGPAGAAAALDLNQATQADLEALPGVGPVLAGRILDQRDQLGGRFTSVGDLREVPGIGEARFQSIAELVRV